MGVYPTEPLYRLRDAILADDKKAGAEATIDLIAGFLSDIRRIADAMEENARVTSVLAGTAEEIERVKKGGW